VRLCGASPATDIRPLSLHDALPISRADTDGHGRVIDQRLRNRNPDTGAAETYRLWTYYRADGAVLALVRAQASEETGRPAHWSRSEEHTSELQSRENLVCRLLLEKK